MHSLHTPFWLFCTYFVISTVAKEKTLWPTPEQEAIDEIQDAQIFRAVRSSMTEWSSTHHKHMRKKRAAVKKVCYNEVGCFEDSGPFSYLEMLPDSPEAINTKFYFYSTKNRSERPLMELPFLNMSAAFGKTTADIPSSTEGSNGPETTTQTSSSRTVFSMDDLHSLEDLSVRVIVHGFGSACPHVWIYEMKTALMAVENCIVICVDWEKGAILPNYVKAAANTRLVGKQLAMLIQNLKEYKGLNLAKTHIIGFSLGAHVSGFAGAELPGLSRITGLDPAGPLFESQHPKARLDSSDAAFVDVIHSNGENLILGGLGSWQAMGHVDFYPNGGRVQTGCSNLFVGAVTDFIWSQPSEDEGRSLCNHRRAYKFFIDSVAPRCLFPAFPCESYDGFLKGKCFPCSKFDEESSEGNGSRCGNMGYYANRSTGRGQLYLVTREEEPFCAHQFQLQIFNSFNDLPLRTIGRLEATLEGEGGLNETFLISEKDDTEFFAGDIVSKIIVPHPALGFPTNLSLQYKSYSGWLAKGLPHWDIDKVILTDSFGRNHSLCRPSLSLTSGSMVRLNLLPGDCQLPDQDDYDILPTESATDKPLSVTESIDRLDEGELIEKVKYRKDIFNLGTNFKLDRNKTFELKDSNDIPWHPILESNSLDRDVGESSRSLQSETAEIFEPVLKDRRLSVNKGRNLHDFDERTEEIVEPVLRSTTPKFRKVKQIVKEVESTIIEQKPKSKERETVTIQLFPFRLGELLERAERYAKETLLPLISEQAPRFFGFGTIEKKDERKPRYIPRYEEQSYNNRSASKSSNKKLTRKNDEAKDLIVSETQGYRNIFDLIRNPSSARTEGRRSISEVVYYTNDLTESRSLKAEDVPNSDVRIDLPTYRPPSESTTKGPISSSENTKKSIGVSLV